MRKRTISHLSDTIFWYIVYLLPIFCYLLAIYRNGISVPSLPAFFESIGVPVLGDLVSDTLNEIFGVGGILPLYGSSVGIPIFSWYVSMMIIHLAVDFLLFIPRLAHKWMNTFCKED